MSSSPACDGMHSLLSLSFFSVCLVSFQPSHALSEPLLPLPSPSSLFFLLAVLAPPFSFSRRRWCMRNRVRVVYQRFPPEKKDVSSASATCVHSLQWVQWVQAVPVSAHTHHHPRGGGKHTHTHTHNDSSTRHVHESHDTKQRTTQHKQQETMHAQIQNITAGDAQDNGGRAAGVAGTETHSVRGDHPRRRGARLHVRAGISGGDGADPTAAADLPATAWNHHAEHLRNCNGRGAGVRRQAVQRRGDEAHAPPRAGARRGEVVRGEGAGARRCQAV